MKVVVSEQVQAFLSKERIYLRRHSNSAFDRLLARLKQAKSLLSRFPESGVSTTSLSLGERRLVVGDYIIYCDIVGTEVHLLHIRHGRQSETPVDEKDFDYEADL